MKIDILVIGGGTGGHLFPAIATLEEILKRGRKGALVTDNRCMKYLRNHDKLQSYIFKSPRPLGIFGRIKALWFALIALIKSYILLIKLKPDLVIGFGGYVTYPTLLAAKLMGIPIMLHEQNCFLGKVNKFYADKAQKLCLAFEDTKNIPENFPKNKLIITGNPVRSEIIDFIKPKKPEKNIFRILITGGSQGASFLSETLPEAINLVAQSFPKIKLEIMHQARLEDIEQARFLYSKYGVNANVSDFFYNMPELLTNADLLIGRAGASTIAEIIAINLPAILIPYPYAAEKHQHFNAEMVEKNNGGFMIDQDEATPLMIAGKITYFVSDSKFRSKAKNSLKKLQKDSTHIIVDTAEKIIRNFARKI